MKNKHYIYLLFALLILPSCGEDFLERDPLDQITEDSFYNTASEANLAVISAYAVLQGADWYGKCWQMLEIPSDNTTTGGNDPNFSPIDNFTVNADNVAVADFWREHFKLIIQANQIIKFVPAIDMPEDSKNSLVGEAKFLRAFAYFDLVRIYGGVPLVVDVPNITSEVNVPRNTVDEVYALIEADLIDAVNSLPQTRTNSDFGRATFGAANTLLSSVYLTLGKYDECIEVCNRIIASGQYILMEDFSLNWLKETSDNNAESIFQIQYVGCGPFGSGNANQAFYAPWGEGITQGADGWGSQIPTAPNIDNPGTTIRDLMAEDDLRSYHTIMTPGTDYPMINPDLGGYSYPAVGASRSNCNIKKYVIGGGPDVCFMSSPQNYHVFRYAEVLLNLVEASCKKNGGISNSSNVLDAFNQVRTRAGLESVEVVEIDMLYDERRKEFAFENKRWFDLLRQGGIKETMLLHGKSMQDYNVLFPIPSAELAINNKLVQNPGY